MQSDTHNATGKRLCDKKNIESIHIQHIPIMYRMIYSNFRMDGVFLTCER